MRLLNRKSAQNFDGLFSPCLVIGSLNVYVTVGKQKPPRGILLGDFCFPIIFNLPISQIFCQIVVG